MDIFTMLQIDEGLDLQLYKDTLGYYTIGIGHLVSKNPAFSNAVLILNNQLGRSTNGVITRDEAISLFNQDVETAKQSLQTVGLGNLLNYLSPIRQAALINMSFQLGAKGVANFKNSMSLLAKGQWDEAAENLKQSNWYRQTTNRANRVIETFRTGTWDAYS